MFKAWRLRRAYERDLADIPKEYAARLRAAKTKEEREVIIEERGSEEVSTIILYEIDEAERLMRTARRLGLEYKPDPEWWREIEPKEDGLSEIAGHAKLRKLIRDERFRISESWIRVLIPILSAIISILSLLIAFVAISKSK